MFEYGFAKAKELAKYKNKDETIIYIPKQLVLFVEENKEIPDEIRMKMIFPNHQEVSYNVPTFKYWKYTQEELVEKKLYPLLPLQVFSLRYGMEKLRKKGGNKLLLKIIIDQAKDLVGRIGNEARKLYDSRTITADDLHKILLANKNLFDYLNEIRLGSCDEQIVNTYQITIKQLCAIKEQLVNDYRSSKVN